MHDDHDDHDDYAHDYDHTEVDHDQDGLDDKMPHNDNNPVEEGSKLHLEIHRAVDELGKYAIELDIHNKELSKETIKGFIDEMMRQSADDCFRHGADLIGHIKAFYKIDNVNDHTIMFSMVDPSRPTNIQDQIPGETVIGGLFVLHVIVHGIWDDVIRDATAPSRSCPTSPRSGASTTPSAPTSTTRRRASPITRRSETGAGSGPHHSFYCFYIRFAADRQRRPRNQYRRLRRCCRAPPGIGFKRGP